MNTFKLDKREVMISISALQNMLQQSVGETYQWALKINILMNRVKENTVNNFTKKCNKKINQNA